MSTPKIEETAAATKSADTLNEEPPKLSPTQGEGNEEKKTTSGGTESGVAADYLPINKLKDTPSASHYEGANLDELTKTKGPGLGAQISEKVHELKDKVTHKK